jgi:hypothetical protein
MEDSLARVSRVPITDCRPCSIGSQLVARTPTACSAGLTMLAFRRRVAFGKKRPSFLAMVQVNGELTNHYASTREQDF